RPGKGNDKGKVEGLVGYARRNFMVPIPVFESFEAFNAHLLDCCRKRMGDRLRGHDEMLLAVEKHTKSGDGSLAYERAPVGALQIVVFRTIDRRLCCRLNGCGGAGVGGG